MKRTTSYNLIPLGVAALGGICLALRLGLYTLESDSSLLPPGHPLHIATLVIALATAVALGCFVFRLDGSHNYNKNFPASPVSVICGTAAGLCLIPAAWGMLTHSASGLHTVRALLGFISVPCVLVAQWHHFRGKRSSFLFHAVVCLFFAVHMICQYQLWSGNPQLEDCIFPLFGCVFLSLTAYYRTAFDVGLGRRRMLLFCGLMAVFFCLPSIAGGNGGWFFLAGALWAASALCVIDPPKKARNAVEE